MFGHNPADTDDSHHLLGRDGTTEEEVVWEQSSVRSERNTATSSELWEQDPLSGESHELQQISNPDSRPTSSRPQPARSKRAMVSPGDHGEAATDLQAEFERIFSPMKKNQEEKGRFHGELDAACAAYSSRLEETRALQREHEEAIEQPWLVARRRRQWQRVMAVLRSVGIFMTCFCGGTVARLEEIPPEIPWPPPSLTRMMEHHAEERKALREAHLAVVHELHIKYMLDAEEEGQPEKHVCVERRLLQEVLGEVPIPSDEFPE